MIKNRIFLLTLPVLLLYSCMRTQQPYNESVWKDYDVEWISPERYSMALWLKENYPFCDKTQKEILDKFGEKGVDIEYSDSVYISKMKYIIKQKNNNFLIGIDPPSDMAYLVIYFSKGKVIKATLEERKKKEDPFTEVDILCQ